MSDRAKATDSILVYYLYTRILENNPSTTPYKWQRKNNLESEIMKPREKVEKCLTRMRYKIQYACISLFVIPTSMKTLLSLTSRKTHFWVFYREVDWSTPEWVNIDTPNGIIICTREQLNRLGDWCTATAKTLWLTLVISVWANQALAQTSTDEVKNSNIPASATATVDSPWIGKDTGVLIIGNVPKTPLENFLAKITDETVKKLIMEWDLDDIKAYVKQFEGIKGEDPAYLEVALIWLSREYQILSTLDIISKALWSSILREDLIPWLEQDTIVKLKQHEWAYTSWLEFRDFEASYQLALTKQKSKDMTARVMAARILLANLIGQLADVKKDNDALDQALSFVSTFIKANDSKGS